MKKIFLILVICLLIIFLFWIFFLNKGNNFGIQKNIFDLSLNYKKGQVGFLQLKDVDFKNNNLSVSRNIGSYAAEIVDKDNKVLDVFFFDFPLKEFFDYENPKTGEIEGGKIKNIDEAKTTIKLEISKKDAKFINIYNSKVEKVLVIDLFKKLK